MPSIDVHAAADLFSEKDESTLARELAEAALRAEGLEPSPFLLSKSWVFFHRHPTSAILAGDGSSATGAVRISILAPPGRLTAEARSGLVEQATRIVARVVGDPEQAERTFVLIGETGDGGWGLAGRTGAELVEWAVKRAAS
ncbi:4-oxalocrotonate tautomerase family protein [Catenulispora sp. EB89]|uniref:tautomerase family protein n=1 Tax=Catenulispora sp. EB89 TaxID=3156257 RepID=UPI0035126542